MTGSHPHSDGYSEINSSDPQVFITEERETADVKVRIFTAVCNVRGDIGEKKVANYHYGS